MAQGGLGRAKGHTALAQVRPERHAKRVNIYGPSTFVALRDASKFQVAVENLHESLPHVEQFRVGGKTNWNGLSKALGFVSERVKAIT